MRFPIASLLAGAIAVALVSEPVAAAPRPVVEPRAASAAPARKSPVSIPSLPSFARFSPFSRKLYVSVQGADSHAGRDKRFPLRTIGAAIAKARALGPGTEIIVRAGVYNERYLKLDFDGNQRFWYALRGYPGERPVLRATDAWQIVAVRGAYWLIEGLELNGSKLGTVTQDGTTLTTEADVAAWAARFGTCLSSGENCGSGLDIDGRGRPAHHVIVRDVVAHDFPGGGILSMAADLLVIEDNLTFENANWSRYGQSGISVWASRSAATSAQPYYRILVRRNISYGNEQRVPSTLINSDKITDGNGIIIDSLRSNGYTGAVWVANNLVFGNGGSGIHVLNSESVDLFNNTAYWNNRTSTIDDGEIYSNSGKNVRIFNNILFSRPGKKVNTDWNNTNVRHESNVLFGGSVALRGRGDVVSDPRFISATVDPRRADFGLQGTSPAVDRSDAELFARRDLYRRSAIGARDAGAVESR